MNTALIGLDYIVDITHPSGRPARCAAHVAERDVIAKANRALAIAQQLQWLRILVKVGFEPGYADLPRQSPVFGRAEEYGAFALNGRRQAARESVLRHASGSRPAGESN